MEREYKDSGIEWIGLIPKEWNKDKVNRIFSTIGSGTTPSSSDEKAYEGTLNWIQSGDINGGDLLDVKNKISETTLQKYSALTMYYAPFIIIAMYGASVGNISISYINGCVNQACCVLADPIHYFKYQFYAIKSAKDYLIFKAVGGGQPNISQATLKQLWLPFPPLFEQQKIADYLDKVCGEADEMIALQEKMIEELKAYKQSVITEAVTKGLNPNVPMKDSGIDWIGEIPEHWEICRFKDIAKVKANLVHPDDYYDYPQIAPDNIEKGSGRLLPYKSVKEANVISDNHLFFRGQIIYSKIRPVLNKLIIAPFDGLCSADMYPIETTNDINYLKYYMLSEVFVSQVALVVQDRVKMPKINKDELGVIYVLSLPMDEQRQIASFLDLKCSDIDSLIAVKQQKIEELKEYKKSVIYEYVTGKKEVI